MDSLGVAIDTGKHLWCSRYKGIKNCSTFHLDAAHAFNGISIVVGNILMGLQSLAAVNGLTLFTLNWVHLHHLSDSYQHYHCENVTIMSVSESHI